MKRNRVLAAVPTAALAAALAFAIRAEAAPQSGAQGAGGIVVSPSSARPSAPGPAANFTGNVRVQPIFGAKAPGRTSAGLVTFEPGARSAWHTHPLGQALIVTEGTGWIGYPDGTVRLMRKGDVVQIPAGVRHWHGATSTTSVTHYAVQEESGGKNVEWQEKVADEQYEKGPSPTQGAQSAREEPSAIGRQLGDFAPKMVQLTDDVLFGDVWERPELSPRDRSLVTTAALAVGGNAEQLPFHLNKGKENGLTEAQVVEELTHLAFYTGWPRALSAINVAKATFRGPSAPQMGGK